MYLSIEWLKLRKYKTFWVLGSLFLILLPVWNWAFKQMFSVDAFGPKVSMMDSYYVFPQIWATSGHWTSWFINFLAMSVIIITTNEFTYKTSRQNIIDGHTRLQAFHAKAMIVVILSVVSAVYYFITALVFGWFASDGISDIGEGLLRTCYMAVYSLNYLGFAYLLSLLLRRSGLTLGLFIMYSIVLDQVLVVVVNKYVYNGAGRYLLLQSSDNLFPFPPLQQLLRATTNTNACLIASLLWCGAYYLAGRMVSRRQNL